MRVCSGWACGNSRTGRRTRGAPAGGGTSAAAATSGTAPAAAPRKAASARHPGNTPARPGRLYGESGHRIIYWRRNRQLCFSILHVLIQIDDTDGQKLENLPIFISGSRRLNSKLEHKPNTEVLTIHPVFRQPCTPPIIFTIYINKYINTFIGSNRRQDSLKVSIYHKHLREIWVY